MRNIVQGDVETHANQVNCLPIVSEFSVLAPRPASTVWRGLVSAQLLISQPRFRPKNDADTPIE